MVLGCGLYQPRRVARRRSISWCNMPREAREACSVISQVGKDGATDIGITMSVDCHEIWLNDLGEKLLRLNTDTPPVIADQTCTYDRSPVHLAGIDWDGRGVEGGEDGLHNAGDVFVGD